MKNASISGSLGGIFCLKHLFFSSFDSTPLGLSINRTQERVLMMAWHHENATMQFLSHEAGLEKGSLTTIVDSLESLGLVQRVKPEEDRRAFIVRLTPAGNDLAEKIEALFRTHLDNLLSTLTDEEHLEFERALITLTRLIPRIAS